MGFVIMRFYILRPIFFLWMLELSCSAAEQAPAMKAAESEIDNFINNLMVRDGIRPAPPANDYTIIRRLSLDLIGRIPTLGEVQSYVNSRDPQKKILLIDKLMASPAFIRYQAQQFDSMMTPLNAQEGRLRNYFVNALKTNRAWSQIFRELVTPDENDKNQEGSTEFLKQRLSDVDRLTNEVSVLFFGVNVSCAQCHDHPLVNDWKQDHFYGMKAFFSRTVNNGGFLAESEFGALKFKPNRGAEKQATPMFLTGQQVSLPNFRDAKPEEQKLEKVRFEKAKAAKKSAPAIASARTLLVETALKESNADYFARSIANRMWHRFMGFGLVNPVDQMHSENPSSHPELLKWLAQDTMHHKYDLRRLIRLIVTSDAYARSSRYPEVQQPAPRYFAVARLKALTPMQLATSLKIATALSEDLDKLKPELFEKQIENIENRVRDFANLIAQPTDDFQIGVNEALLFSNNNKIVVDFLVDNDSSLLGKLKKQSKTEEVIDMMFRSVLCRPPTADEQIIMQEYLNKRSDRKSKACEQMLWALITCSEFRFNH